MNKEKFEKILRIKKIKYDFYTIKNINNKKKIAFFYLKNKIIFLLKISLNTFTSNQFKNEINSYKFIKKKKIHFLTTSAEKFYKNKSISILKIKYVNGKKGSFFDLKKFYLKKYIITRKIKFSNYLNILKKNFKNIHKTNLEINNEFKKINDYFDKDKLKICPSHGDFVHWNTITDKKKHYVFDLEYFSKERIFLYDILHWVIQPYINKLKFFNYTTKFNIFLIFLVKYYLNNLNIKFSDREIIKYIIIYFLEIKYTYYIAKDISKKHRIISPKNLKRSKTLFKFCSQQISYFLRLLY